MKSTPTHKRMFPLTLPTTPPVKTMTLQTRASPTAKNPAPSMNAPLRNPSTTRRMTSIAAQTLIVGGRLLSDTATDVRLSTRRRYDCSRSFLLSVTHARVLSQYDESEAVDPTDSLTVFTGGILVPRGDSLSPETIPSYLRPSRYKQNPRAFEELIS